MARTKRPLGARQGVARILRARGWTLKRIAEEFRLSPEAVRQILLLEGPLTKESAAIADSYVATDNGGEDT